jgi:predicted solute-binding protein
VLRVSAVSYLNTWPLVWGFLHGRERGLFDFRFDLPAQCADALGSGEADIGLVPCAELDRLGLDFLPDLGIACDGPVRSILLISKRPFGQIRTLAADAGSRTSVALTRILLGERYGCRPAVIPCRPDLGAMMRECDAALIIGDPALRIERERLPWYSMDLGEEWVGWTGLPMVFAVWAGRKEILTEEVAEAFRASYRWGASHTDEIVRQAGLERGVAEALARDYVTRYIVYRLEGRHRDGLELFREKVRKLEAVPAGV